MNENLNHENQNEEEEFEVEDLIEKPEESIEKKKKGEELNMKKNQPFKLLQSKDTEASESVWGNFKIRPLDVNISESELYFRTPLTNIIESEDAYYLLVELPGLDKKNVEISLQEGILEILGEKAITHKDKKEDKKEKDKDKDKKDKDKKDKDKKDKKKEKDREIKGEFLRREFRSASFYRSFLLPEETHVEEIDANFRNGILILTLPKKTKDIPGKHIIDIK